MRGYIKLYRQLLDNPLFTSEPFSKGQAWITILMLANHKESYITTKNGILIKIERGECGYSELALSKIFKWSRGKVKRFLQLLESEKMIQQKISENHSIIRVLNYEQYQDDTINSTINDTINGQLTGQLTDTNNNDKNDNNDKNVIFINAEKTKKTDPYINPVINEFKQQHEKIIGKRVYLNNAECNKLTELAADVEDFSSTLPTVLKKLKKLKFDGIGYKPNASWLLKENHYTEILNGAYDYETREEIVARLEKAELERRRNYANTNGNGISQ